MAQKGMGTLKEGMNVSAGLPETPLRRWLHIQIVLSTRPRCTAKPRRDSPDTLLALAADAKALPPNPRIPVIIAVTKKISAYGDICLQEFFDAGLAAVSRLAMARAPDGLAYLACDVIEAANFQQFAVPHSAGDGLFADLDPFCRTIACRFIEN